MQRLVRFDNLVTDDLIVQVIEGKDMEDIFEKAWQMSKQTGLSEGNFDIFKLDHDGNFVYDFGD